VQLNHVREGVLTIGAHHGVRYCGTLVRRDVLAPTYLLPSLNVKLRPKLCKDLKPRTRIVSHISTWANGSPKRRFSSMATRSISGRSRPSPGYSELTWRRSRRTTFVDQAAGRGGEGAWPVSAVRARASSSASVIVPSSLLGSGAFGTGRPAVINLIKLPTAASARNGPARCQSARRPWSARA